MKMTKASSRISVAPPHDSSVGATQSRRGLFAKAPLLKFGLPAIILLTALSLLPAIELVRISLNDVGLGNVVSGEWQFVGAENFIDLPENPDFGGAIRNTFIFVAIAVVGAFGGGMLGAQLIRPEAMSRRVLQGLMILAWSLPPVIAGSVWKFMLSFDGVVNAVTSVVGIEPTFFLSDPTLALYAVALITAWQSIPFAALVLKAGLLDIPDDQFEAAAIDGASRWQTFRQVTMPQLRPVSITLIVLLVVYAFRSFDLLFVMTEGGPGTSTTTLPYLSYRTAFVLDNFGSGAAIAIVSVAFIMVVAVVYSRLAREEAS